MAARPHDGLFDGLATFENIVQAKPRLTLEFYEFGIILRKPREVGETSYAVSPDEIAELLSAKFKALVQRQADQQIDTGLLVSGTLFVSRSKRRQVVIEYREPQVTGLFIEGAEEAYRVPLPGLILVRTVHKKTPEYRCYAVKHRPVDEAEPLFRAPLPHMGSGSICWGTVPKPSEQMIESSASLAEDWKLLLGSKFGTHTVNGLSRTHPKDIRQKYAALEQRKAKVYPARDLIEAKLTFGELLDEVRR